MQGIKGKDKRSAAMRLSMCAKPFEATNSAKSVWSEPKEVDHLNS